MKIQSTSGSTASEPLVHLMRPDRGSSFSCQVLINTEIQKVVCQAKDVVNVFHCVSVCKCLCIFVVGELQRKIGLKVLEMGGNAVVGYLQCFDLEGESGLVVRAIGTACTLEKISTLPSTTTHPSNSSPSKDMKE